MSSCAVATCKNYSRVTKGTSIKYFRFPKDINLSKKWANACRREDEINFKNGKCLECLIIRIFNQGLEQLNK